MTDNLNTQPTGSVFKVPLIEQVFDGMHVVSADGKDLGKVEFVKFGDPEALTTQGNELGTGPGFIAVPFRPASGDSGTQNRGFGLPFGSGGEPDVVEPLRSQLLREGFLKIDGGDLFDTDRYVRADQIIAVTDKTVRIALRDREVPTETGA